MRLDDFNVSSIKTAISSKNDHETTDREIFRNIQTGPFLN